MYKKSLNSISLYKSTCQELDLSISRKKKIGFGCPENVRTFSVGMKGSTDVLYARKVAEFLKPIQALATYEVRSISVTSSYFCYLSHIHLYGPLPLTFVLDFSGSTLIFPRLPYTIQLTLPRLPYMRNFPFSTSVTL
jgi:hypothetical protein